MKHSCFFILLLVVTSCASGPSQDEINNADYGIGVSVNKCINIAKSFISNRLKDPPSARFSEVDCYQGWESSVPLAGVKITYGYRFVGYVNAKNSFGGYTGYTQFTGVVRDDGFGPRVIRWCMVSPTDEYNLCIPQMVN